MPRREDIRRILVLGSGPIIIGQAAEFDYAGTQACQALREEGIEVILANSNPATIMTDPEVADRVYLEPLTVPYVTGILEKERPDAILPTLGGQVGLNLAVALAESGVLERLGVEVLGTPLSAIRKAEDREAFRSLMLEIGEPIPKSRTVISLEDGLDFAREIGFPVIVRPAYTLGGTGGGIAGSPEELTAILRRGLALSPIGQALLEESIAGWKEIEYEVMRDGAGTALTVCNMENLDPVGIHTGDSVVVAPSQTMTDSEYQRLRQASLNIIGALGVEGGCNVQYGLHPETGEYRVIEVNPRVSRSSALASKATGYPIAKIAAKIAIGYRLWELPNPVTGQTTACFEPTLDYVVVKIPRWPFDKFRLADRLLGTQMKATGEVMAIERTFEAALQKAVRSLETGLDGLTYPDLAEIPAEDLHRRLRDADDERLFLMAEAARRGMEAEEIARITGVDSFFTHKIAGIIAAEVRILREGFLPEELWDLKRLGFSDRRLGRLTGRPEIGIRRQREEQNLHPVYKMVDTCAGEFEAQTPYFYGTYEEEDEANPLPGRKVLVIGSGPIRIGQGIEFDCCSVQALEAMRAGGHREPVRAIMINCNPETVSTDWSMSDRLYFEPLTAEEVVEVAKKEQPEGVIIQLGGQTAINMVPALVEAGIPILGTSPEGISLCEDRARFDALLEHLGIPRPPGRMAGDPATALAAAEAIGYPVLVRPSFVLGGRAMAIISNSDEMRAYLESEVSYSPQRPVLIDKYYLGQEIEVDAVSDGETVLVAGIMEHVERAGVHSGDSTAVYPAPNLSPRVREQVVDITTRIARAAGIRGLLNIQFVVQGEQVSVLEANPRASRTIPYLSKVTGLKIIALATSVMLGETLADLGYRGGLYPEPDFVAVKMPVFSWAKLARVDASLGPEMKSTGEVLGIDRDYQGAMYKAFIAAGIPLAVEGAVLLTVADKDKEEALPVARLLHELGHPLYATAGTAERLRREGLPVIQVAKLSEGSEEILDLIRRRQVSLVVNTQTRGQVPERDGFQIRRAAVEHGLPCLTSLDTVRAMHRALADPAGRAMRVRALQEWVQV